MSRRPIRFEREARAEVEHSRDWYEERRSGLGHDFVMKVDAALIAIQDNPEIGTPIAKAARGSVVRRKLLDRFPYFVAYVVYADEIIVYAVGDLRRRPNYWRWRTIVR